MDTLGACAAQYCVRCGHARSDLPGDALFSRDPRRCRLCVVLDSLRQACLQLEPGTSVVGVVLTGLELLLTIVLCMNSYIIEAVAIRSRRAGDPDADTEDPDDPDWQDWEERGTGRRSP